MPYKSKIQRDGRAEIRVSIPDRDKRQPIKREDGDAAAHTAPHPIGTVDFFPEDQAAGEYRQPVPNFR